VWNLRAEAGRLLRTELARVCRRNGTEQCRKRGLVRKTIGKAYQRLAAEGLVYRVPGLGYYVSATIVAAEVNGVGSSRKGRFTSLELKATLWRGGRDFAAGAEALDALPLLLVRVEQRPTSPML